MYKKVGGCTPLISSQSGASVFERFKYCNVLKWDCGFTFGLSAAEISDYMKKLFRMKFCIKKSQGAYVYAPGVELGGSKDFHL